MGKSIKAYNWIQIILGSIVSILIFFIAQFVAITISDMLPCSQDVKLIAMFSIGTSFITIAVGFYIKKIIKKDLKDFYISNSKVNYIIWIILGYAMVSYVFFVCNIFKVLKFNKIDNYTPLGIIVSILVIGILPAYTEELIFRGVIFNFLKSRLKLIWAMIIPSIGFALVHIIGYKNMDLRSVILLAVGGSAVGVLFSCIAYISKSIFASAIVHAIWNIFITGNTIVKFTSITSLSFYDIVPTNSLLDGGAMGVQASIPVLLFYIVIDIILLAYIFKKNVKNKN